MPKTTPPQESSVSSRIPVRAPESQSPSPAKRLMMGVSSPLSSPSASPKGTPTKRQLPVPVGAPQAAKELPQRKVAKEEVLESGAEALPWQGAEELDSEVCFQVVTSPVCQCVGIEPYFTEVTVHCQLVGRSVRWFGIPTRSGSFFCLFPATQFIYCWPWASHVNQGAHWICLHETIHILIELLIHEWINPLRPSIKLQILLLCFHTFITDVKGRSCSNINTILFEWSCSQFPWPH